MPLGDLPLAGWARAVQPSPIQELLTLASRPGLLSFALGLPAAEIFPAAAFDAALSHVLGHDARALQYEAALPALRAQIVKLMARRGVTCSPDEVFVTAGAQQGLSMLARVLLEPGQRVMVEDRTYTGILQVLEPFAPAIVPVATDAAHGIDVDAVEAALAHGERPAFLYTISDGHNPLGVSTPRATRERLASLARTYRVPIVEDDAYGLLRYDDADDPTPPIRAFEDRYVFYVGSFSKTLAPGVRVGWVVVPRELTTHLSIIKESYDINTANLVQRAVLRLLEDDLLDTHLPRVRDTYRVRRDTMLRAIGRHFPSSARVVTPACGMFAWVELPTHADTGPLLVQAVEREKIAFVPGAAFAPAGARSARHAMRLCFSSVAPAAIEDGIARLGALVHRAVG